MASVILMKTQKIGAAHRLLGHQSVTGLSGYLRAENEDDLGLATGIQIEIEAHIHRLPKNWFSLQSPLSTRPSGKVIVPRPSILPYLYSPTYF